MDDTNTTPQLSLEERLQRAAEAAQERIDQWNTLHGVDVLNNIEKVNSYGLANILR